MNTLPKMVDLQSLADKLSRNDDGAAAVEFALGVPIMLTMLIGVVEVGRLAYTQSALYYAAQEATRYAIVRNGDVTDSELEDFAENRLVGVDKDLAVLVAESPTNAVTNTSEFTVSVSFNYKPMLPILPGTLKLSASSSGFVAFDSANNNGP